MTYGNCIKQARETMLLTQEQLAEQLDISRPWKIATAALAAVCLVLAVCLAVSLLRKEELPPEEKVLSVEAEPPAAPPAEAEPSPVLPDSIPMICSHDYSFGDWTVGTYDPAAVPFLDDWERVMDSELWCGWFPDGTRLSLVPVIYQRLSPLRPAGGDDGREAGVPYLLPHRRGLYRDRLRLPGRPALHQCAGL